MDDDMLVGRSTTNPVISHTPSTKRRFVVYGLFDYIWREKESYREIMREQFSFPKQNEVLGNWPKYSHYLATDYKNSDCG